MSELIDDRNEWRDSFNEKPLDNSLLNDYKENRDSELWRTSRVLEQLCEYIIFLENKTKP